MMKLPSLALLFLLACCFGCLPSAPDYPVRPAQEIRAEAVAWSAELETYIKGWLDGENPAEIPSDLIPEGIVDAHSYRLMHPDSATREDIWAWRLANPINLDSIYPSIPDPNVTYYLLGPALAPFGSKLHIEGEFPHCRFFSIQMSPTLSGEEYCYDRGMGPTEVSIVDADIDPLPGHVNPFRVGADRNANKRSYHVTFELAIGDPVALSNGNFAPPYRHASNTRHGGLLQHQGPWGTTGGFDGLTPGNGEWNIGALWIRIYAPDQDKGPLGGADFPKVYYELPDGRQYFITANFDPMIERVNATLPAQESYTAVNQFVDASAGWLKSFGVLRNILSGVSLMNGWTHPDTMARIRAIDLGVTGRGGELPAPRNYEPHATTNNYANYLGRYLRVDTGYVAVLTGKLPSFPDTRSGSPVMEAGQMRYWSIVGYDNDPLFPAPGSAVNAIMDDELILDNNGNYIICYSRPEDRPWNANTDNGISWVNWGPTMDLGLVIRYVTITDGWEFEKSPTELNLNWQQNDLASSDFNPNLTFQNWHKGWMDCYLPRVHYMRKEAFEALLEKPSVSDIPVWVHDKYEIGLNDAANLPITASSVFDNSGEFGPEKANDLDKDSRWASQFMTGGTPEWLQVDLGSVQKISAVKIAWLFLGQATAYEIQVSDDGNNWLTIYDTEEGQGGVEVIDQLQVTGRFVRVWMTKAVLSGYSIHMLEVYTSSSSCLSLSPNQTGSIYRSDQVKVYPNPFVNQLNIEANDLQFDSIKIHDLSGALLHQQVFSSQINLSLPAGTYILSLENKEGKVTKKIIKQ